MLDKSLMIELTGSFYLSPVHTRIMSNIETPLCWGILSAGQISSDCLQPFEHQLIGIAARSRDSAQKFANEHQIPNVYDSYEELVKDPQIRNVIT